MHCISRQESACASNSWKTPRIPVTAKTDINCHGHQWELSLDQPKQPAATPNCWEYTGCGFEKGGKNAAAHGVCPASPHRGNVCLSLENTKCHLTCAGLPTTKWGVCAQCNYYRDILAKQD